MNVRQLEALRNREARLSGRRHSPDRIGELSPRKGSLADASCKPREVLSRLEPQSVARSATVGDFSFVSDPLETSSSQFAELGRERNGSFYPHK